MENPEKFLDEKYPDLAGSRPVERAVQKKIQRGEKGPENKEGRVQAYFSRIEEIVSRGNSVSDERGWELLKNKIIKEFAINDDPDSLVKIAYGLYEAEKKLAVEQGRGRDHVEQGPGCRPASPRHRARARPGARSSWPAPPPTDV